MFDGTESTSAIECYGYGEVIDSTKADRFSVARIEHRAIDRDLNIDHAALTAISSKAVMANEHTTPSIRLVFLTEFFSLLGDIQSC